MQKGSDVGLHTGGGGERLLFNKLINDKRDLKATLYACPFGIVHFPILSGQHKCTLKTGL